MSTEIDEFRQSLVAAVQAELDRHATAVVAEVDRLRDEGRRERAELKGELVDQMRALAQIVEQVQDQTASGGGNAAAKAVAALEQRLDESDARQKRRIDDVASNLDGLVQAAARPVLSELRDEHDALTRKVDGLDGNLRKFDEQAARMVTYFNDVTSNMELRQDELADTLKNELTAEIARLKELVEENDSAIRRFQGEVGQSVSQKINDAEDRFNNRLLGAESRMKEEAGTKIAEIDLHVSRVSSGLDDTMNVLNDRIAALDERFVDANRRIDGVEESIQGLDSSELDELKEKMSAAAGEAMLVRIEMERLEKSVAERTDGLGVRMTEVETQLQDATMDVSTAVQLDRLEQIERTLMEIDPSTFVRKGEVPPAGSPPSPADGGFPSPDASARQETLKNPETDADALGGIDLSAIVAADEDRSR